MRSASRIRRRRRSSSSRRRFSRDRLHATASPAPAALRRWRDRSPRSPCSGTRFPASATLHLRSSVGFRAERHGGQRSSPACRCRTARPLRLMKCALQRMASPRALDRVRPQRPRPARSGTRHETTGSPSTQHGARAALAFAAALLRCPVRLAVLAQHVEQPLHRRALATSTVRPFSVKCMLWELSTEAFVVLSACFGQGGISRTSMPRCRMRVHDRRRGPVDRQLAESLRAERSVGVRILQHAPRRSSACRASSESCSW